MISAACTGTVFLLNVVLTIWAVQTFGVKNGYGTLIAGDCSKTKRVSTWTHLVINVFSTLLLGASNYCMQILTAPTRSEIDRAHAKGWWLDIGVLSIRNLHWISGKRVCIWICLALSSLPLHLLYNSAVYDTLAANEYTVWTASEHVETYSTDYWLYQDPKNTTLQLFQQGQLQRLDRKACIAAYGRDFVSDRRDVVLVLTDAGQLDNVLTAVSYSQPNQSSYAWLCSRQLIWATLTTALFPSMPTETTCNITELIQNADKWRFEADFLKVNSTIEYCLSQNTSEHCQLQFSIEILIIVVIVNLVKLVCMLHTVSSNDTNTIVTLGDAIASFLQDPDSSTIGRCTLSERCVVKDKKWYKWGYEGCKPSYNVVPSGPEQWDSSQYRWLQSASNLRWWFCYSL